MKIGKYEFKDQETAEAKIKGLGEHDHAVVNLGHIILEIGEYDEEGKETKAPVLSSKYHLDVMWVGLDDHPYGWKSAAVGNINDNGVHSFYGVDYQTNKM
tara:strand:+ start:1094 stop:1393 length:300 start_codon:yes stop_codon:yes gene_type:complete